MRSVLLTLAAASGLAADAPAFPLPPAAPASPAAPAAGTPLPAASAATPLTPPAASGNVVDRQFLFSNPAADALALTALSPNATNPLTTLLLASAIDDNGFGGRGGYGGGYGGGYYPPPRPVYPSYPTYYQAPITTYPLYPSTTYYPPWTPPTPSWAPWTPPTPSWSTPTWSTPWVPPPPPPPVFRPRSPYPDPPNDPLKQAVILNGIQQGTINPVTAVSLDRNTGMNALGAYAFSSLGDTPLTTVLAATGGFNSGFDRYGGTVFGQNNGLGTYLLLNAATGSSTPLGR